MSESSATGTALNVILACAASLCALACGGQKASVREIPPEVYSRLDRAVPSYGDAGRELFAGEEQRFASLVTKFTGGLHRTLHPKFHHDPRLDSVAWLSAHAFADKETRVAPELTEWVVNRLGIVGHVRMAPAWYGEGSWGKQHIAQVLAEFSKKMRRADWDGERYVFGVARLRVPPERFALGLVIVEQSAILDEIPKRVEPGETIVLRGRMLGRPEVGVAQLSVSDLESYGFVLPVEKDGRFSMELPAPAVAGPHRLQMVAWSREGGAGLAVDVPIHVGLDEPARPDPSLLAPPSNPPPGPEWEQRILRAMNDLRRRFGLEPLTRDPVLDTVMAERVGKWAVESHRRLPPIWEDLLRKKIDWRNSHSSMSHFEFLSEVVEELAVSSYEREAVLDPGYSRLGIATAAVPHEGRGPRMYRSGFVLQQSRRSGGRVLSERTLDTLRREVARYDDPSSRPAVAGPLSAPEFAAELEEALAGPTGGRVRHEPALDMLAAEYLAGGSLPGVVDDFILRRLGFSGSLIAASTRLVRRQKPGPHLAAELAARANVGQRERKLEYRFGVAREPRGENLILESVVVVSREMAFEPFPRCVEPGEEIIVEGRFLSGDGKGKACELRNPTLWLDGPDREVWDYRLEVDRDCGFAVKVVAPKEPGTYRMEFTHAPAIARDRRVEFNIHSAAEAEIVVGGVGATEPDPAWLQAVDEPAAPAERLDLLRRRLREFRTAAGLSPLEENRLATALLADQLMRGYHLLQVPTFQDVTDALEANGGGDASLGFGGSLYRVAERMDIRLADPSVRRVLLDPATVSYGLATDPDGDVFRLVFLGWPEGGADKGAGADSRFGTAAQVAVPLPRLGILAPAAVSGAVEKGRKKLIRCFKDEAAWVDDDYAVETRFGLVAGATGKVIAAWPVDDQADPRGLEECILDELRALSFPVPTPGAHGPGAVFVSRQLHFTRKGEGKVELAIGE
ncbi:MAG TPA: hypothetical protein VM285_07500 [Polyangia bacterium]|nr:hypothetical protein [Polyangia bacterium]